MIATEESFKQSLTRAGFHTFSIIQTKLNHTKTMRTEEQKDEYIKELETKLHSARGFWMKQQAEIKEHLSTINKLKQDLQNTAKAPLMQIELPEQHASDDIVEQIRLAFPKKVDPAGTRTAIKKAIKSAKRDGMTPEALLKTTKAYAREIKRFVPNKQHELWGKIQAPAVWFNQQRYELDPETWTAHIRQGKYVAPEKAPEVETEPKFWREVVKHIYPECDVSRTLWPHFSVNHPDIKQEVIEEYAVIVRELKL